jgi:hypothetical protein
MGGGRLVTGPTSVGCRVIVAGRTLTRLGGSLLFGGTLSGKTFSGKTLGGSALGGSALG